MWLTQCELCEFCLNQLELNSCCCSAQCVLCRRQSALQVLLSLFLPLLSAHLVHETVFMTRDMLRMTAQENLVCASRPTWLRSLCLSMGTLLLVLENRLGQTEETLVAERRASRRTAEVAQQVVRTRPAGVDVEEIGRLEMFSGDGDLNGRVNSTPWSQLRFHCSMLLWRAQPDVDPVAAAGGNKRGRSDHR